MPTPTDLRAALRDVSSLTDDELQDAIRSGITAARNGKPHDRAALRAALAEFKRRESDDKEFQCP